MNRWSTLRLCQDCGSHCAGDASLALADNYDVCILKERAFSRLSLLDVAATAPSIDRDFA